jgi:uncharacterized membrane protein
VVFAEIAFLGRGSRCGLGFALQLEKHEMGMGKARLEAFSDGVLAIIITIMVLELKVPHGEDLLTLAALWPVFLSYILSFVYVGIYWNNHHHLMHVVTKVSGSILWANLFLLFWLSLLPFSTGWMGENHFAQWPVFVFTFNLLMAAVAYTVLVLRIKTVHGEGSDIDRAIGSDAKGKISLLVYIAAMAASFFWPIVGVLLTAAVAVMWVIPDRRIEKVLTAKN